MDEKSELEMKGTLRLSNAAALEKYAKERGQKNFQESPQNMYTWDYVMVFKVGDPKKTVKVKVKEKGKKKKSYEIKQDEYFRDVTASVVQKLRMAGLKTDLYYSVQKDEIYCRIAASERRLMEQASRIDYDLQLDKTNCLDYGRVIGVKLAKNTDLPGTKIKSEHWENLYGKYDMLDPLHPEVAFRQELYIRHNTEDPAHPRHNSLFSTVDRLRLTYTIIEAEDLTGGAGLAPNKLIANQNHPLIACFPLHEEHVKQQLEKKWYHWTSTFKSPLPEIRGYFGESVAFYFAFLAFYNRALIAPAIIGLALFIWQMAVGRVDVEGVVPYAILISCWATLLIEYWKRREAKYRVRWGMTKFLEKEQPRPEFKGQWKPSPVDGKLTEIFPWHKKLIRALLSQTVIWTLIVVVIASVVSIFFFREVVKDYSWGIIVSAIINAIQIQILNFVYGVVARGLNSYENHRTDTEYENALISKTFLFKFINSYNSLYYIAFFKEYDNTVKGCLNDDCLKELQQQLGTIFISLIVIANTIEIGVPYIMQKKAERDNRAVDSDYHARQASLRSPASAENSNIALTDLEANVESDGRKRAQSIHYVENSQAEKEFELAAYEGTFDDFDEMVIQFGYVTLFVVAFPLAPLLALINNFIETRLDSTKLCKFSRRPEPKGAYNIGTWYDIINVLSYIAVITNALIICFQTKLMTDWAGGNKATKAYVFILSEHTVLLIKFAISYFVPDVPLELVVHEARQEYIVSVLIKGMEEDDDDDDENSKEKDDDEAEHTDKVEFDWEGIKEKCTEDPGHEHRSREEETPAGGAVSDAGVTSPSI